MVRIELETKSFLDNIVSKKRPSKPDIYTRRMLNDIMIEKTVVELATKRRDCNLCMDIQCIFRHGYTRFKYANHRYVCNFRYAYRSYEHQHAVIAYKYRTSLFGKIHTGIEIIFEKLLGV